MVATILLVVLI